jgi:hypothetical protein
MEMIKEMIIIIVLFLAFPFGFLLAHWARDELVSGRKWFKIIIYISAFLSPVSILINRFEIFYTMLFILIVTYVSYKKSFDKKFVKKRI